MSASKLSSVDDGGIRVVSGLPEQDEPGPFSVPSQYVDENLGTLTDVDAVDANNDLER